MAALRRRPVLTAGVVAVTALSALAQLVVPGMLADLERDPAALHGEWWRPATALFVQDGGVLGAASNIAFLAVIGAAAEQVLSRPRWLLHYFGVGLAVEAIGLAWQPVGGGNSIAVCGLAGAVALAPWRAGDPLPTFAAPAVLLWCAALLGTISGLMAGPAIVAAIVAVRFAKERPLALQCLALAAVVVVGAILAADQNIHGAALLIGLALAFATLAGARGAAHRCARTSRTS
jgi:membrane associated rhomboid family serine protease